jgi:hypothetical protein
MASSWSRGPIHNEHQEEGRGEERGGEGVDRNPIQCLAAMLLVPQEILLRATKLTDRRIAKGAEFARVTQGIQSKETCAGLEFQSPTLRTRRALSIGRGSTSRGNVCSEATVRACYEGECREREPHLLMQLVSWIGEHSSKSHSLVPQRRQGRQTRSVKEVHSDDWNVPRGQEEQSNVSVRQTEDDVAHLAMILRQANSRSGFAHSPHLTRCHCRSSSIVRPDESPRLPPCVVDLSTY